MNVTKQDWTVNNITEEQKKLAEENHNLIYRFLSKYNLSIDDYYDIAAIGLCKAAMTFDKSKSKFSTYAFKCMYMIMLHEKRKEKMVRVIPKDKLSVPHKLNLKITMIVTQIHFSILFRQTLI